MTRKAPKFYVVWKGRKRGIFRSWEECSAQVTGFVDAEYKAFDSLASAEKAFAGKYADYKGKTAPKRVSKARLISAGKPAVPSLAVDAACSGNPGLLEYRGVDVGTRREVFRQGPFEQGTNNVGEFLAIVHALAMLTERGDPQPIYSDSRNAIKWVKGKKCLTKLAPNDQNRELFGLIARAEAWLSANSYPNKLLKWETDVWGEIPADFGRK